MIPPNRIEQLNDFNYQLQRDDPLTNLRAMQALQQGIPSLMMGMPQNTGQAPMLNMSEGGITSLPVIAAGWGFNPFKPIQRAVRSIGKGVSNIGKGIGKGLSGILGGLTGGGNTGDMLKTMALMAAFSMMGPVGGMNPHVWRAIYGGFTPGLARGKLKFDPMSSAMTVGGGWLGDKLTGPAQGATQGPLTLDQMNPLAKFTNPTGSAFSGQAGNLASNTGATGYRGGGYGQTFQSGTQVPGMPSLAQMPDISQVSRLRDPTASRNLLQRNIVDPMGQGLDYVRDIANLEIPGADTLQDLGQTDVGLKSINDIYPGEYEIFKSNQLFPDAAPNVGRAVAGGLGGIEASQIYNEQAKAEQDYNDWMADQEAAAEQAQMPTREWLKRIVDDPVKFTYNYKGPLSYEELVNRYTQGAGDTETAQMFDPATFITESGRDPGMYGLGQGWDANARYGGYLPEIRRGFGSFFRGPGRKVFDQLNSAPNPAFPVGQIPSGGGGFGLGGLFQDPNFLRQIFRQQSQPTKSSKYQEGDPVKDLRVDNTGEDGPMVETAGIQQIRQPSAFERKGLMSQEEMTSYDNNMVLLLEENKKAVARKEPNFTLMGETFQTNPNGAPTPVGNQGQQLMMAAAGGTPQQFFSGRVPNTTAPGSDGMSDQETMLITDQTGRDPRGIMKISEQEYVMSAPDMAILGNGDPVAGAELMDNFRGNLRQAAYGTRAHQPRLDQNKALSSLAHRAFG